LAKTDHLLLLAQGIAEQTQGFFEKKGPGVGDHATGSFVRALRQLAKEVFGADYSEKVVCEAAGFRFDFFFPDEGTAVEFAFGLHDPNSEFERDILKCILAIEDGCKVRKLILVGKPGAIARLSAPAPKAIVALVGMRFNLAVEILELRVWQQTAWKNLHPKGSVARANCSALEYAGTARAEVPVESGTISEQESRPARQTDHQPADSDGPQSEAHNAEPKSWRATRRAAARASSVRPRHSQERLLGKGYRTSGRQTLEVRGSVVPLTGILAKPGVSKVSRDHRS
jgi:hypothetical protein